MTLVRTTVNIDEELLRRARELATRTRRSLGDVVDDGLRVLMAQRQTATAPAPVRLPTDGGSGLQPGVDLEDKEALAALLDDERPNAPR